MALTSTSTSSYSYSPYASSGSAYSGSEVKDNSSKTMESSSNTGGSKSGTSASHTAESQSSTAYSGQKATVVNISPDAWNASATPNSGGTSYVQEQQAPAHSFAGANPTPGSVTHAAAMPGLAGTIETQSLASSLANLDLSSMWASQKNPSLAATAASDLGAAIAAYAGVKQTTASLAGALPERLPAETLANGTQRSSREAVGAYSSLASFVIGGNGLADILAVEKPAETRIFVAANESKWPSNGGPDESPDIRLRQEQQAKPIALDVPGAVKDIGMGLPGFLGGAFLVEQPIKVVPNPDGRKGNEAHQAGVKGAQADLIAKYANDPNVRVDTEVRVETPGGEKNSRYLDVGALGGDPIRLVEGIQVGRTTQSGIPVARERRALDDIAGAAPWAALGFRDSGKR